MGKTPTFVTIVEKDKNNESGENEHCKWALAAMQGWRYFMEDEHIYFETKVSGENVFVFGVFDGHGGYNVAYWTAHGLQAYLEKDENFLAKRYEEAIHSVTKLMDVDVLKCENDLGQDASWDQGTTFNINIITPTHIICGNIGDSRSVMFVNGEVKEMSHDHKPNDLEDRERIDAAGGFVSDNRVDGQLAVSRSIGDYKYKGRKGLEWNAQKVVPVPGVVVHPRTGNEDFLICACDGLWEVHSSEKVCEMVNEYRKEFTGHDFIQKIINKVLDETVADNTYTPEKGGLDNMSCIMAFFDKK